MSIHLIIKNENCPNSRTVTPEKKGPFLFGDSIAGALCVVVENKNFGGIKNLVKKGWCLWSRL